jgi:hypothetical protein
MANSKYPKIKITNIVQRANDLVEIGKRDKDELLGVGLQWEMVEQLAQLAPKLDKADAVYQLVKEDGPEATRKHKIYLANCIALRSQLAQEIRDAFKTAGIKKKLHSIRRHDKKTDLVQDLNDLATIGLNYREEFKNIYFNFELAQTAAHRAKELEHEAAKIELYREDIAAEELEYRNKLYDEIYRDIFEICRCGRRAFKGDPNRLRSYRTIK